jgi:FAD/FMN-containing dehydrogenase
MNAASIEFELSHAKLDGHIIGRRHPDYDKYRKIWNGVSDRHPAVIVRAVSIGDVKATVKLAAKAGLLLAVRSGAHSLPGHSSCDDGVVLDMSLINGIALDKEKHTVEVGGGALLGDLDAAGSLAGLVTPAGVVSHTGVAGLTLGGGMGWLSRRFGMTIDNLLGAEVVTANGNVVWASEDSEPELFWGIRGGGGNFGVVTKFKFRMHNLGEISVGFWIYKNSDCFQVLHEYNQLAQRSPRELTTGFTLTSEELSVTAVWSGATESASTMVSPFGRLASPISGSFGKMPYVELQKRSDESDAWGQRHYSKGGFVDDLGDNVIEVMMNAVVNAPNKRTDIYVLQLGGAISDIAEDATPYSGRTAAYYWIANAIWDDPSEDAVCIEWSKQSAKALAAISMQGNYVNEQADAGKLVSLGAYGLQKYERLARLKARFDPTNVFKLNQNIEPMN